MVKSRHVVLLSLSLVFGFVSSGCSWILMETPPPKEEWRQRSYATWGLASVNSGSVLFYNANLFTSSALDRQGLASGGSIRLFDAF